MALVYETYGPFDLERDGNKVEKAALIDLWVDAEKAKTGLSTAVGVYIFTVQASESSALTPWYVGRTDKQGFKGRFPQQVGKFREIFDYAKRGNPKIFLLARVTPRGTFMKPTKNRLPYNNELESLLIGSCLAQNPDLLNASKVKHLRDLQVPGYRNNKPGKPTHSAKTLADMLRGK